MTHPHDWLSKPGGLAEQLLELRKDAGLSGKELASAAGWAPSKVSRLERGRQMPSESDIRTWIFLTHADQDHTASLSGLLNQAQEVRDDWRHRMAHGQVGVQVNHNALTEGASLIRYFETMWIPGFLQTHDYATVVLKHMIELHDLVIDDVPQAVSARLRRRSMLFDTTKRFELLIAEPVLRWLFCPSEIMQQQLVALTAAFDLSNVRFGIYPLGHQVGTPPQTPFQIYDDLVVVETFRDEREFDGEAAGWYGSLMDRLWDDAVEGDEALRMIKGAIKAFRQQPS